MYVKRDYWMEMNQFNLYSVIVKTEKKEQDNASKTIETINKLESFNAMSDVKKWLQEAFGIKDDILNFGISADTRISVNTGQKYFNVTVEYQNEVKSYNYNK